METARPRHQAMRTQSQLQTRSKQRLVSFLHTCSVTCQNTSSPCPVPSVLMLALRASERIVSPLGEPRKPRHKPCCPTPCDSGQAGSKGASSCPPGPLSGDLRRGKGRKEGRSSFCQGLSHLVRTLSPPPLSPLFPNSSPKACPLPLHFPELLF